jgi:hypothetical protein
VTGANTAGAVDVAVTSNGTTVTLPGAFTYVGTGPAPAPPPPAPPPPPPPACTFVVCDDLNGSTVGQQIGGAFDSFGFVITDPDAGIIYNVPTITSGFLEFEATSVQIGISGVKYKMIAMTDGSWSSADLYRATVELRGADKGDITRMKFLTGDNAAGAYIEKDAVIPWDPTHTYLIRLEWGPGKRATFTASDQTNGAVYTISASYANGGTYAPPNHVIRIGNPFAGDHSSMPGIRVRKVRIGTI